LSNSALNKQMGRIAFLLSTLVVAALCVVARKMLHAHSDSHRVFSVVGYGMVLLGVFWTRAFDSRLRDAGLPRWTFWPYFLIVFTVCLGANALKFTNTLETLALFLVFQLPALLLPPKSAPAESSSQAADAEEPAKLAASHKRNARPVTPLGPIEFAVYVLLIAGLLFVLHLLRGDLAGLALPRALRYALDAASVLLCVPWIFSVRGRFNRLGLMHWYPICCVLVLIASAVPFALHLLSFQHAIILFVALQLPAVLLRREFIPAGLVRPDASEEADSDSSEVS
jgi:hypothetical protein